MTDIDEKEIADVVMSNLDDLLNEIPKDKLSSFLIAKDRSANILEAVNAICMWVKQNKSK